VNPNAAAMLGGQPPAGWQYILINLTFTYLGAGQSHIYQVEPDGVIGAAANIGYDGNSAPSSCRVSIPNYLPSGRDQFSGSSLTGNRCYSVPTADVPTLVLYFTERVGSSDKTVWFALH
jgi:hypothetical protein